KGWEVKPIGEIAEFTNGLSYKGSEKFNESKGYFFVTLNNVKRGGGFKLEYSWIQSKRIKPHHFLNEGDLIIANTDMTQEAKVIGSPAIVVFPYAYEGKGVYSHHITKVTLHDKKHKLFLYLFLKATQSENTTFSTGTTVLGLDLNNFKENKFVIIPPQQVLEKFNSLVEPLFKKIILNEKEIMLLKEVRDALLPQLVFGRLRVEEI
ncbi:MAG: type restriction enzyme subunit, partial [Archaeoglobi archaeon]|nr:type restriction enzyme subunit [Archaeoglobi archaeon]